MSLPRYGQYKRIGIDWLAEVPAHWECVRLGTLFREVNEPGNDDLPILSVSIHDGVSDKELDEGESERKVTRSDDRSKYKAVAPGDLTYNTMRAWQGGFGSVTVHGMVSPAYVVARPRKSFATEVVEMLLRTPNAVAEIKRHSRGITDFRLRLYWDDFKDIQVVLPPLDEQTCIVAFIERETAKIDALIAEQERLIALLAEKRQATVSHVVTRGLNPVAPMKDSGVAALGEIAAHWTICTVRRVLERIEQGWSPECLGRPAEGSEWGVLKTGCVNRGVFNPEENKALPETLEPAKDLEVRDGDLLMSRASGSPELVGSAAYIANPPARLMVSDKTFRLHAIHGVLHRFLALVFGAAYMRRQIEQSISGADGLANNLPQSSLKSFVVALPPREEQLEVIDFVERETTRLDALQLEAATSIALLRERRSALITAAVTGQIDVRNAVPQPAAETEPLPA